MWACHSYRPVHSARPLTVCWCPLITPALLTIQCTAVYFYTSNSEQEHFESAFQESTQKVLDSIGKAIERTLGAVDSYATTLVSHARATNQSWPFVTFPDFAVLTEKTRSLSAGVIVSMQ